MQIRSSRSMQQAKQVKIVIENSGYKKAAGQQKITFQ
jgi:hypothetical protein